MNFKRSILFGGLLWILVFVWWSIMMFVPGLKDMQTLQYIIHYILLIIAASLITGSYYKSKEKINGFVLGLIFLVVGIVLDAIITVPLFTSAQGTGHMEFFFAPLMLLGYLILVITVGITKQIM